MNCSYRTALRQHLITTSIVLLGIVLNACNNTVLPSSFQISVDSGTLSIGRGETKAVIVRLFRPSGFTASVIVSLVSPPAGIAAGPVTIPGGAGSGSLEIRIAEDAPLTTQLLSLRGTAQQLSGDALLVVTVTLAAPIINRISLDQSGRQVRQGADVTLKVEGQHLTDTVGASLGELVANIQSSEDSIVTLEVSVPSGAALGPRELTLTTTGGSVAFPEAITITEITAGPLGNDATGMGTPEQPFRSLTKALSVASSGDVIHLQDGTYGQATGETWPTGEGAPLISSAAPNVPAGVAIHGESSAGTVLTGPGDSKTLGLALIGDAHLSKLTLENFGFAVVTSNGSLVLENVRITDSLVDGLLAYGDGVVTIMGDDSAFINNMSAGIHVTEQAALEASAGTISGGGAAETGLRATGEAQISLTNVGISQAERCLYAVGSVAVTVVSSLIFDCRVVGVLSSRSEIRDGNTDGAVLNLIDSEIKDSGFGISFSGASLRVRDSLIHDNTTGILVAGFPNEVDLGTASQSGGNSLDTNASYQLHDARPERSTPGGTVITMSGSTLGSSVPDPFIFVGPYDNPPQLKVEKSNNLVQFF